LENGVVNLVNGLPPDRFRHAVVALTEIARFRERIRRDDVEFVALHKPPGQGVWCFARMRRILRALRPAIVHTRNLAALEMTVPAAWAGVPIRIHGEHGWDVNDPDGRSTRYRVVRRMYRPFVHHYVALSRHLARYLSEHVGIAPARIAQIYNGVDTDRFHPPTQGRASIDGSPFPSPDAWIVGSVGRLQAVKNPALLARAFIRALELAPDARAHMRLVMVGDGPLAAQAAEVLRQGRADDIAWLAGDRTDVPDVMRGLDAFVLPSLAEGVSNTILEAMATGLPVVATDVGGNGELLVDGGTGRLVPSNDVDAMAHAILDAFRNRPAARERGQRARDEVVRRYSLDSMLAAYASLYDRLLSEASARGALVQQYS
jgi:sugar transferase (PEP-CTERM/EpsH1 system associated)